MSGMKPPVVIDNGTGYCLVFFAAFCSRLRVKIRADDGLRVFAYAGTAS